MRAAALTRRYVKLDLMDPPRGRFARIPTTCSAQIIAYTRLQELRLFLAPSGVLRASPRRGRAPFCEFTGHLRFLVDDFNLVLLVLNENERLESF